MIAFNLSMSYLNQVKIAFLQNANTPQNCQRILRSLPALKRHHLLSALALGAAGCRGRRWLHAMAPLAARSSIRFALFDVIFVGALLNRHVFRTLCDLVHEQCRDVSYKLLCISVSFRSWAIV